MADYSYSTVPGKIPEILKKIKNIGVPAKVDGNWLKSIGYTSSNDSSLITTLKSIGFIDGTNIPTTLWKRYRSDDKALAEGIVLAYQDLFNLYHDAYKRSKEELSHFFKTKSSAGAQAISKTVSTFTSLCSIADFSNLNTSARQVENDEEKEDTSTNQALEKASESISKKIIPDNFSGSSNMVINLNIQLTVPETTDETVYEKFFQAMKKHLLS